ncbi:MAG: histidine kinase [Lachnospiraceae bacterium]|nr:histidine kinase [Lachnospiraceae bacterium]
MNIVVEYLSNCYPTVMALLTIIVMVELTKRSGIFEKTGRIYIMVLLTFALSLLEFAEIWIDEHNLNYRLLFYKAMLIYSLYPMVALLFYYFTSDVKHKFLIFIPQLIKIIINVLDLFGTRLIYYYYEDHGYEGGTFNFLPFAVEIFYVVLICVYSVRILNGKNKSKGIIMAFCMATIIFAQFLTNFDMPSIYLPTIIAIEILVYYFYIAAIQYNENKDALVESELALERNRNNLLLAQIKPHFINSNLAVIRSLCYEEPEKAVEMLDHFSGYLRENIQQIDDMQLVSFEREMESVDNFVYLEMQRFPDKIEVIKDIKVNDFFVPPLSVQTIVENAIRHGISMTGKKGTVRISTLAKDDNIIVKIEDNGKGFDVDSVEFDGINHVGIKNVANRLKRILNGKIKVESEVGYGTIVTFYIPRENVRKEI